MAYTPKAWAQERASWKAVIQLNLIRSINTFVDALGEELASTQSSSGHTSSSSDEGHSPPEQVTIPADRRTALMKLRMRLTPLRQIELDLKARLGAGTEEITEASLAAGADTMMATPFDEAAYATSPPPPRKFRVRDVVVRSHRAWKERERALKEKDRHSVRPTSPGSLSSLRDSATEVIASCADDMAAVWLDPVVREIVRRRRLMSSIGDSAE
jgi:guanine nucleotide-binding protein alpha-1 subunit